MPDPPPRPTPRLNRIDPAVVRQARRRTPPVVDVEACAACGGPTELRVTPGGVKEYHRRECQPVDHRPVHEDREEGDLPSPS